MRHPSSRGALTALGALAAVGSAQAFGVSLLTPQVATTLKVGAVSLLSVRVPALVVDVFVPLAMPSLTDRRIARVRLWAVRVSAMLAALTLVLTGSVRGSWALVAVLALGSLFASPGRVLTRSVAMAEVSTEGRVRALAGPQLGGLAAQAALTLGIVVTSTTWHHALVVAGVTAVIVTVITGALLRPTERHAAAPPPPGEDPDWGELGRSWQATPSLFGAGIALTAIGFLLLPYDAVLSIYLRAHFHLTLHSTAGFFLAIAVVSIVGVLAGASYVDRLIPRHPGRLARVSALALGVASVLLLIGALIPSRPLAAGVIAVGAAVANLLVPTLIAFGTTVAPPAQRTALASAAMSALALGGMLGLILAVCVADRHGTRYALVSLAGVGVIGAGWWYRAAAHLDVDQQRIDQRRADQRDRPEDLAPGARQAPGPSRLLVCHDVDFSYGSLQVLFGVDAYVDDGEIVGLLGTNGAGKSTLLRVISGLGVPQRGSVTFAGRDITYLDAEARVRIGITQVPGGKAVFRSMNVVENLQSYGYTLGRSRRDVDEAIERCFEAFPRLRERRSSAAAMLSGGEQQMVALSKALILRPKLLLIDELSLGLAPVIVDRLLDMVRRINADGTAVVIVEQSITTALALVHRAYFMEKGEVRFDGAAADLIDRHDLLRAVFLEGAVKGVVS